MTGSSVCFIRLSLVWLLCAVGVLLEWLVHCQYSEKHYLPWSHPSLDCCTPPPPTSPPPPFSTSCFPPPLLLHLPILFLLLHLQLLLFPFPLNVTWSMMLPLPVIDALPHGVKWETVWIYVYLHERFYLGPIYMYNADMFCYPPCKTYPYKISESPSHQLKSIAGCSQFVTLLNVFYCVAI